MTAGPATDLERDLLHAAIVRMRARIMAVVFGMLGGTGLCVATVWLLLRGGPQPSVDVRTGGPVGVVSSTLVAPGMSMIGARAGCRYLDQVPSYLNNLFRLGLVWFSREQLEDPMEYQVLEAQPDVLEAMHSVRFPKVVRRSIHLTPFGTGFCRACLVDPEETDTLPEHQIPEE